MEGTGQDGNTSGFHLNFSLSDIKPDLDPKPITSGCKDVGSITFLGRSFRMRDAEELLQLRRDLASIKMEKTETASDMDTDTGMSTYAVLNDKVNKLAEMVEEIREQLLPSSGSINANGDHTQSSMESSNSTRCEENIVSMDMKETSNHSPLGSGPPSPFTGNSIINSAASADSQNGTGEDNGEEQSPINSNPGSTPLNNKAFPMIPNYIDITVLPGKPVLYRCNICQKRFNLKVLIMNHDNCQKEESIFKCQECGRGFINKSHYEYHIRMHERQLKGHERTERVGGYKGPRFFLPQIFY
ncbi:putative zinc finger protein [Orchesella cincta]|uniref:Putative zinc finger protein n=1 Tax=Orchesella cincta TaxID=48709 RepID=A0A1D2MCP5_ORCCI|nr:putative zinc finger protein [Orchesella cincta]